MNESNNNLLDDCIKHFINGMYDWVRVVDRNNNIIFINSSMAKIFGPVTQGTKCYELLGRDAPCEFCISRESVFDGYHHQKHEVIGEKTFSVMSSPIKNKKGEIFAAVEVLRDITPLISLQNKIMEQNSKLQNDLDMARKLQCSLLPKNLPNDKIRYSFIYKPCETLGGDFLDIFKIDDKRIGIYISDVSGHGVSASMLTIFLRTTINKKYLLPSQALFDLFKEFNNYNFSHDLYITVFYAIIDLDKKIMTFSNAGHNTSPIVFNKDKFRALLVPGIPISNWMESPNYIDRKICLQSKDRLFLYTDGISEIRDQSGEQYGEKRLLKILLDHDSQPSTVLNRIVESVCQFGEIEDASQLPDDIAMTLIEIQ
jgi:sigma-B regulation protein RsbU (phosphoserine phosphatase)